MVLYFESDLGCGVREAANMQEGKREILAEVHAVGGTVTLIREATEHDMLWVRPRGGCVDIDNQVSSEETKMNILKHVEIDCESYADVARRHGVVVEQVCEMDNVDHVGFGGCAKSRYVSPKTGQTLYVLERAGQYTPDAYTTEAWITDTDFSETEAIAMVKAHDETRRSEQLIQSMIQQLLRWHAEFPEGAAEESWTSDPSGGNLTRDEFAEAKRRFFARRVKRARDLRVGDIMQTQDGLFVVRSLEMRRHEATQRDYQLIDLGDLCNQLTIVADVEVETYGGN